MCLCSLLWVFYSYTNIIHDATTKLMISPRALVPSAQFQTALRWFGWDTANLCTNIMDFRGFDSSIIFILRGRIPKPIGNFPESLSQPILVGIMLAGRLGVVRAVACGVKGLIWAPMAPRPFSYLRFRKFQSRVWTNLESVVVPRGLKYGFEHVFFSSKLRLWNLKYEISSTKMAVQKGTTFALKERTRKTRVPCAANPQTENLQTRNLRIQISGKFPANLGIPPLPARVKPSEIQLLGSWTDRTAIWDPAETATRPCRICIYIYIYIYICV